MTPALHLHPRPPLVAENAGLFVSAGGGAHPDRVIGSHELIFVRSGTLAMSEADRDVTTPAGGTLLLWPGRRHRGIAPYPKGLSFYWVHFRVAGTKPIARRGGGRDGVSVPQRATPARPDRLAELFHRFLDDQESGRLTAVAASLLVQLMLCEAATAADPSPTSAAAVLAARAEAVVARRLHERDLSASRVAAALDVNADYLTRALKAARGLTLTDLIHRRRLKEARAMLLDGAANAKQVAARCGFADAAYLRRLFKRHEGVTPAQFRRLYARTHVNVR